MSIPIYWYAKQANDKEMVMWASEIKVRAERKLGEMLKQSADDGSRAITGGTRAYQYLISDNLQP